ncbi:radical SAM protein [Promethearchaeum syntrophicum]|uniref:Radical SAM protein n=1 Tax=Promethearchaeum syntrophicum TaxID=2594042 RepID=A0A5B9D6A0_9ARCH|nr:radical SAM protein [Candidatus Prometheoarchaeum syntrophicum]QEE14523.1 molybdenum cofactor biosynthesis protein A [Candidatus Prometheoarchaeum syntrophicum]
MQYFEEKSPFYPDIVQIEITTNCNFHCKMCLRNFQKGHYQNMPLEQFEAMAEQIFPKIKKVVLYGHGEPLMHPDFEKLVKYSRKYLPKDGKIDFTTNGSLLTPEKIDKILLNNINKIIVSFDTSNFMKLKEIRSGIQEDQITSNFQYLSKQRKEGKIAELAIETVIMRSNLHDLPYLIEYCSEFNVDSIYVSHVLPYDESMLLETLYFTVSKESWEISQEIVGKGWEIFQKTMFDPVGAEVSTDALIKATNNVEDIWKRIREHGIETNPPLIFDASKKFDLAIETERVFNKTRGLAKKNKVYLELPEIFPMLSKRVCPYVSRNAIIVRVNGDVATCYNFLHNHKVFINNHERYVKELSFGNLHTESLDEIVQGKDYYNFRKILLNISKNIPWSGDCLYSTTNCFFVSNNDSDCYGNSPGCNECLYSVGLVNCIF